MPDRYRSVGGILESKGREPEDVTWQSFHSGADLREGHDVR